MKINDHHGHQNVQYAMIESRFISKIRKHFSKSIATTSSSICIKIAYAMPKCFTHVLCFLH